MHGEMGKWWREPEISKKLLLSDGQIAQLDQIFYDHRVKLIDHGAEMEKQDLKLQSLLDADQRLLLAIEHSLAVGTPEALEPLTLLVESSSNNDVETIPHKEHRREN